MLYNLLKTGAGNKDWEYFSIDAVSGLIQTAMRLDREKQAVYNVSTAVGWSLGWAGGMQATRRGRWKAGPMVEMSHHHLSKEPGG